MKLDGTLDNLFDYLRQAKGCHGPHQPCKERLLLQYGRAFEPEALTTDELSLLEGHAARLGTPLEGFERKQCFFNAQRLVTAGPDGPLYCEGYCYPKGGIPVHHAWLTLNGKVVDVTLHDRETGEPVLGEFTTRLYVGISFETRLVRSEMLRTGSASTLLESAMALEIDNEGSVTHIKHEHGHR